MVGIKDIRIFLSELLDMYTNVLQLQTVSGYELSELIQLFQEGYELNRSQMAEIGNANKKAREE